MINIMTIHLILIIKIGCRLRAILKKGGNPKVTKDLEKAKIVDSQKHTIQSLYALATEECINNPIKPWTPKHAKGMA